MGNSVMNIRAVPNGKTGNTLDPEAVVEAVADTSIHISLEVVARRIMASKT